MIIKQIIDEDFVNYKKASMFIAFPSCTFKCGIKECQNSALLDSPNIKLDEEQLIKRYINNPITSAIVCGGLEPFDSWDDLYNLIKKIRMTTDDDVVIYTGYYEAEINEYLNELKKYKNIIVKFGRFKIGDIAHYDEILGVKLISNNQYSRRIS